MLPLSDVIDPTKTQSLERQLEQAGADQGMRLLESFLLAELEPSIVFDCDDVGKTYETMKANGVAFEGELQKMQWGTFATFLDEDGNSFLFKG